MNKVYDIFVGYEEINDFDFELPEELIAQTPLQKRDTSRFMVLNRENKTIEDKHFYDIANYFVNTVSIKFVI